MNEYLGNEQITILWRYMESRRLFKINRRLGHILRMAETKNVKRILQIGRSEKRSADTQGRDGWRL